jgi:hypothetical protein
VIRWAAAHLGLFHSFLIELSFVFAPPLPQMLFLRTMPVVKQKEMNDMAAKLMTFLNEGDLCSADSQGDPVRPIP